MPKYRYDGEAPVRIGGSPFKNGDVMESAYSPGKRWVLMDTPVAPVAVKTARKIESVSVKTGGDE